MEEFFSWEDRYDLGVPSMNDEHKVLIKKMNDLHTAVANNASSIQEKLESLVEYTIKHFKDEEMYMESINYPGVDAHKLTHKKLLSDLAVFGESYKESNKIPDKLFPFLRLWLSSHICGIDMKYAKHNK